MNFKTNRRRLTSNKLWSTLKCCSMLDITVASTLIPISQILTFLMKKAQTTFIMVANALLHTLNISIYMYYIIICFKLMNCMINISRQKI